jgi:hypothetical protein
VGATSRHYEARQSGTYKLLVTVDGCSSESNAIVVSYNGSGAMVQPDLQSQGNVLCDANSSILLTVSNHSAYPLATYVWYSGDTELQRGTSYSYLATDAGLYSVYVYVQDGCGSGSDTLSITAGTGDGITKPVIISESGGTVICGDEAVIILRLTTDYTGAGTTINYQWFKDNSIISGANQTYYYAREAGTYKIFVTVDNCSAQSDVITVTYDGSGDIPSVDLRSENNSNALCSGSTILLYVNNSNAYSSDATYVWYDGDEEKTRGVNMYNYSVASSGNYSVLVFEPNGCLAVSIDTISISVVDSLIIDIIHSSLGTQLIYNESTDLTVTNVQGGIPPYIYTWYKKTEGETSWTEVYTGGNNTFTTGNLTESACYKVVVSSSDPLLTCNVGTDSICIEVSQVELSLEFMNDIYSICNSTVDSISLRITNSKPGFATNVLIEFNNEGTLPSLSSILIDSLSGDSDTTIVIYLPENMDNDAQIGLLKAEIISCDQTDANPLTVYGNWRDARNWVGDPQEADEDVLNLTLYPDLKLLSPLDITICSGETFTYIPESNLQGTIFTWERLVNANFEYSSGIDTIREVLNNIDEHEQITAQYVFTLGADFCPSSISDTITVLVSPKPMLTLRHEPDGIVILGTPVTIYAQSTATQYGYSIGNSAAPFIYVLEPEYRVYEFNEGELNTVRVSVINDYGCEETGIETFEVRYNLPNVITPKELTNTKLLPPVNENGQDVKYDIQVFSRWGSELYRGTEGWDGRYKGSYVASGTYYYVLRHVQPNGKVLTLKRNVFVKY